MTVENIQNMRLHLPFSINSLIFYITTVKFFNGINLGSAKGNHERKFTSISSINYKVVVDLTTIIKADKLIREIGSRYPFLLRDCFFLWLALIYLIWGMFYGV